MLKRFLAVMFLPTLFIASAAAAQNFPVLDEIAQKVIAKYQNATCEQLWKQQAEPKSQRQQEAIKILQNDPQMQQAFFSQVATPIVTRMFQCGMIP